MEIMAKREQIYRKEQAKIIVKVEWKNTENGGKHLGNLSKHGLLFSHDIVNHGPPKRSQNGHFFQSIVFTLSLGFADVFGRRSHPKRPKRQRERHGP